MRLKLVSSDPDVVVEGLGAKAEVLDGVVGAVADLSFVCVLLEEVTQSFTGAGNTSWDPVSGPDWCSVMTIDHADARRSPGQGQKCKHLDAEVCQVLGA